MLPEGASLRPVEEMRPGEVAARALAGRPVFVPVSPCLEWHSYHLPLGVDGLIAEAVACRLAAQTGGCYCRCLSLGLDEIRSAEFKHRQGLPRDADVFGMNFPGLPVGSEYVDAEAFRAVVRARLAMLRRSGFTVAIIVNHHGGSGQRETLEREAREMSDAALRVHVLQVQQFGPRDLPDDERRALSVGGHAGLAETLQLMAFRPELVDMRALPDGELSVAASGILHSGAHIPVEDNPHRATLSCAQKWGAAVVRAMCEEVARIMDGAHT
jgi:creatinine amidohydrolase